MVEGIIDDDILLTDDVKVVDLSTVRIAGLPSPNYFLPAIVFIILTYFATVDIELESGFVSALFGVALVSLLFHTIFVIYGTFTGSYHEMQTNTTNLVGQLIIGVVSLISSQVTYYVLGFTNELIPNKTNTVWFIYGFLVYQFMLITFLSFYELASKQKDSRSNILLGMLVAVIIGIMSIYLAMVV